MIEYIGIENFRNHKQINFETMAKIIVFLGKNGLGKTNILEAISIIDGSKGIRGAKIAQMLFNNCGPDFKICIDTDSGDRIVLDGGKTRKKFTINGTPSNTFYEASQIINTIWTTPDLEYLFASSQKTRRDFFDKITFCFFKDHYHLLSVCAKLLAERLKILSDKIEDGIRVLDKIESEIASITTQIFNNRVKAISLINKSLDDGSVLGKIKIRPSIKHLDLTQQDNAITTTIANIFAQRRERDAILAQSTFSHNRFCFDIDFESKITFENLSSGQMKLLLICICLGFAKSLKQIFKDRIIVLLLDDFLSKLDFKNSDFILTQLEQWPYGQIFITSTGGFASKDGNENYKIFNL